MINLLRRCKLVGLSTLVLYLGTRIGTTLRISGKMNDSKKAQATGLITTIKSFMVHAPETLELKTANVNF